MSETQSSPGAGSPPDEVVEAIGVDAALLRSADATVVVDQTSGDAAVVELEVTRTSGETHRVPVPEQFVDREWGVVRLTELVAWLGVEPDESPDSMRDGYAGLLALAHKYFIPIDEGDSREDATVSVMLVSPGERVGGQETRHWAFGLHPLWDPVSRIPLGLFPSGHGQRTATMASEVEKAPPLPEVGDTAAWPDTLAGWLTFVDGRVKVDRGIEAHEIRSMFSGYEGDYDPRTDPLDPALEEALRLRDIPGALPPPEGLPEGVRVIGPTRLRSARPVSGSEVLPIVPFENTMFIYDRGRPGAPPMIVTHPEIARREWELIASMDFDKGVEDVPPPGAPIARPADPWAVPPDTEDGDAAPDPEELARGCLAGLPKWVLALVGGVVAVIVVLLIARTFFGDDDSGSETGGSGPATEQAAGVVPLGDYADQVCVTLDENLAGPSAGFQAAFEASSGAAPPTPEATQALYDDLGASATASAAGLTATAEQFADGPAPDVDGGADANQAAVDTWRAAAAVFTQIASVIAAYDPVNATPAETEALGVTLNELFPQLNVLGTEYDDAPEVANAVEAACP
jgi:hypothetical protein